MNKKKLIVIFAVIAFFVIVVAAIISLFVFTREGIAVNSGTFSATASGRTFELGIHSGAANGIYNVANNTWRVSPARANGSSRVNYTFTAANLEALTVRSTNAEGNISLTLTQGDTEKTIDITSQFYKNLDMNGFESGRIRLHLVFENARDVDTLISW
ncbi:MAG: hypothetical protein FWB80_06400 [Defluviitaleaceae bacterium]|nr:hypothetical protein [Defluviitaleaceae bacterium]